MFPGGKKHMGAGSGESVKNEGRKKSCIWDFFPSFLPAPDFANCGAGKGEKFKLHSCRERRGLAAVPFLLLWWLFSQAISATP